MTTTAEKIRDIQIEMKRAENKLKETKDVLASCRLELTKVKQNIKPTE